MMPREPQHAALCVLAARRPPTSARAAHRCSRRPVRMTALAATRCRVIGPSSHMGGAPINATCARAIIINTKTTTDPRRGAPSPTDPTRRQSPCRHGVGAPWTLDRAACGAAGRRATGPLPRGPATDRRGPRARSAVRAERARNALYCAASGDSRGNSAPRPACTLDASADRRSCSPNETPNCASGGEAKWRTGGRARIRGSWN